MDSTTSQFRGACHCGAVQFDVRLSGGLAAARRCNCSYCSMRGAVALSARLQDLHITAGEECLTLYQFNTGQAKHYFCAKCGIYTHHQRRSDPDLYGINAACLEGVSPFDFAELPVNDGRNHQSDRPAGSGPDIAGVLRYTACPRKDQDSV